MLHIVPILCLILFVGLVEYRLKKHPDETNERISRLEKLITLMVVTSCAASESNQKEKKSDENSSNE